MRITLLSLLSLISLQIMGQTQHSCKGWHHNHTEANPILKTSQDDNRRSDTVDVLNYRVYLDFSMTGSNFISGNCEVQFTPKMNGVDLLNLDLLEMTVDSVTQGGSTLAFSYDDTLLTCYLPATMNIGDTSLVIVHYQGNPQQDVTGWGGFYFQGAYSYNLGVGFAADPHNYGRVWHPCFDNFKERATYQFDVLSTNNKTSYCNGYITGETVMGDSLLRSWQIDDPIPSYLANVAVGNYVHARVDHTSIVSGSNIPVWLISEASDTASFKNAFQNVDVAIDAFETSYGPHQWNKVGFVAVPFSSGAMEHATNICYPQAVLGAGTSFEGLMAHELAHHWWGDYTTTETENEMWINEGMATYSEHLFLEYAYGYNSYISEVKNNHKDVLVSAHINDDGHYAIGNVPHEFTYGDHSYLKGADVVHTMRSVMGNSNFFNGLQQVLINRPHTTTNSIEFRDELNSVSTVDVTDFFDQWVMAPGFPQFSIDSFSVVPSGPNFDVTIYTKQRLREAPAYYTNVPFEVTFMDENWNVGKDTVILSGVNDVATITIPFEPSIAFLNENDAINQAVTGQSTTFYGVTNVNLDYSEIRPFIDALDDSVMLRTEHNYVAPDGFLNPGGWNAQYTISQDRYWTITGVFGNNFEGHFRVFYRGHTPTSFDADLFDDGGTGIFHEDSIRLFYRPGAGHEWVVLDSTETNTLGSAVDGYGYITTNSMLPGEYTFGWISGPVGIEVPELLQNVSIYPNPSSDIIWLDLTGEEISNYTVRISDLNGRLIKEVSSSARLASVDVSGLRQGMYLLSVLDGGKFVYSEQIVIN